MNKLFYPAVFHRAEEGGFWVSFPDFPECFTEGDDMTRAYEKVMRIAMPDTVMIDGNRSPDLGVRTITVVKGDQKIPEIMAASIIAKTERDRIMDLCDLRWPEYGYSRHKGYPTKEHRAAVLKYGPSPIERMSFRVKEEYGSLLL